MPVDVVIGAGSGMWEAVARARAATGARLLLADLDTDALDRLAADLGGDVATHRCDITDVSEVAALAEAAAGFTSLVVTAGLSPTMGTGRRIFDVDIVGPARLLNAFLPMASTGSVGVVLSSMAGHLLPDDPPTDGVLDDPLSPSFLDGLAAAGVNVDDAATAYVYAKRGVLRLVRRSAAAWGERGARVVSLSPGIINTPMGRQENEAQPVMLDMVAASALGRMIEPAEIAAIVDFLLSPAAAAITGTDVLVDAGVVARMTT